MIRAIIVGFLLVTTLAKADTCRNVNGKSKMPLALSASFYCKSDEYLSSPLKCYDDNDWGEFIQTYVGTRGIRCVNRWITAEDLAQDFSCDEEDGDLSCITPIYISYKCCK